MPTLCLSTGLFTQPFLPLSILTLKAQLRFPSSMKTSLIPVHHEFLTYVHFFMVLLLHMSLVCWASNFLNLGHPVPHEGGPPLYLSSLLTQLPAQTQAQRRWSSHEGSGSAEVPLPAWCSQCLLEGGALWEGKAGLEQVRHCHLPPAQVLPCPSAGAPTQTG